MLSWGMVDPIKYKNRIRNWLDKTIVGCTTYADVSIKLCDEYVEYKWKETLKREEMAKKRELAEIAG
jgi:hypothetical protein